MNKQTACHNEQVSAEFLAGLETCRLVRCWIIASSIDVTGVLEALKRGRVLIFLDK